jgi:two-component sensor histidine kinase
VEFWFGTNTDITDQREQAEQIRLLLMEVNHRAKNLLGTVQALARRTAPGEATFLKRFEDRIRSLAVNQDILVKREWRQVPARELATAQLAFVEQALGEITLTGPDLALLPRAAETIGMALHELATNALKYGALSVKEGHVDIGWSIKGDDSKGPRFVMWWREKGGPLVDEVGDAGFGTRLIRDVPRHNLGAEVTFVHQATGVCWEIDCPLEAASRLPGTPA